MESVSQKIVEAMKRKGVSLERLEVASGVSERHIMAIMEGNKKKLPAAPYLRGYLMKIGRMLDLDGEDLWKEFINEGAPVRQSGAEDRLPENAPPRKRRGIKFVITGAGIMAVVGIISLQIFRTDNPKIKFENLDEEVTQTKEQMFVVRGSVSPNFKLTLGEEEIVVKEKGKFEKEVILEPGFNTLVFTVKKPLGKEHKFPKQIFYEEAQDENIIEEIPRLAPTTSEVIQ